jgi:hypothetical protein
VTINQRNWLLVALIVACFLLVGWIDNPDDYARLLGDDPPCYVNGRTGEFICR